MVMNKEEYFLGILSASNGKSYTPVQIQKLFFLTDRNIGSKVGGPYFKFVPYHYGPFDKEIYQFIEKLEKKGLIETSFRGGNNIRQYRLTIEGQKEGERILDLSLSSVKEFIKEINQFILSVPFPVLLKMIYKEYPEMKVNSIFHTY
jgi:uncharacterized protein YwgA